MKKAPEHRTLPVEKLRWTCDPGTLGIDSIKQCSVDIPSIIGQPRAVRSISTGLDIESPGYNIYAAGRSGTGKTSTIASLLNKNVVKKKVPDDICYVNNFKDPDMPRYLMLPAGSGRKLQQEMDEFIEHLKRKIPLIFESDIFKKESEEIMEKYRTKQKDLVRDFNEKITKEGFQLVQFQIGPFTRQDIVPLYEGKPVPVEQLEALVEQNKFNAEDLERIKKKLIDLRVDLDSLMRETRQIEKDVRREIEDLEYRSGMPVVSGLISDIRAKHGGIEKVNSYLDEVQENILSNLKNFKEEEQPQPAVPVPVMAPPAPKFIEYKVNVVVDNSQATSAPVIHETDPTYKNLFGTIEREIDRSGLWRTDFTKIRVGSLARANGGYIYFSALDALIEPGVWAFLKRTLKNRKLNLQPYDPFSFLPTALKPEQLPLDVKVVMIGDSYLYHLLYNLEEDFKKIFKIKADFDTEMPREAVNINDYVCFMKKIVDEENLLDIDKTAVAAIVEHGIRLSGRQKKLSTRFAEITDLLRESSHWAKQAGKDVVQREDVEQAISERINRVSLIEEKIQEMIDDGTIMIDTEGAVVGQINGLTVYDMGDHTFGKPARLTAKTSLGRSGVINIEREAKLSGKIFDKGVLIIEGYFRGKYAQDKPLSMSASIAFEQSYSGVDGDSASTTEIYAIVSSLTELPIRQDLAVTGSVNQKGEVQPIGGVNHKIEGFFDVCRAKGLTGTQGVLIPETNVPDLMLRNDVIQAVSDGKFHVYPVKTIDEGIEILTGVEAGVKINGKYPEGTVNYLVDRKLVETMDLLKKFSGGEKEARAEGQENDNSSGDGK